MLGNDPAYHAPHAAAGAKTNGRTLGPHWREDPSADELISGPIMFYFSTPCLTKNPMNLFTSESSACKQLDKCVHFLCTSGAQNDVPSVRAKRALGAPEYERNRRE